MATKKRTNAPTLPGLSKRTTLNVSQDIALELAVYGKAGHQLRDIIEAGVREFIQKNPLDKKVREAALTIIEHEYGAQ